MSESRSGVPIVRGRRGVSEACDRLASGGLVAIPTETVYGLGADAGNAGAVARIYAVKGRPADHPLIVHVAGAADLDTWTVAAPPYARRLAEEFWPGPLTLVLPRAPGMGDLVAGGQSTIALRAPSHPLTVTLLRRFGRGIAAPSANLFGRVSPTSATHVATDLAGRLDPELDLILDGGPCPIGIESTIVDCTGPTVRMLRPGSIGTTQLQYVLGSPPLVGSGETGIRVPGSLRSHYAPRARVLITSGPDAADAVTRARAEGIAPSKIGFLATSDRETPPGVVRLSAPGTAVEYARDLYRSLREADLLEISLVVAIPPDGQEGAAEAVRDRLGRAASATG